MNIEENILYSFGGENINYKLKSLFSERLSIRIIIFRL